MLACATFRMKNYGRPMNPTAASMKIGPAPSGEEADASADTNIIINNQPRVVPPTNYTLGAPDLSARRYGDATLNGTVNASPSQSESPPAQDGSTHINWGAVAKGALIVTAVVVAAVVITPLATQAATYALGALSHSPVFGPIVGGLHSAAVWSLHQLAFAGEFLTHLGGLVWGGLSQSVAGAAAHTTAATLTSAQIAPLAQGFGGIVGGTTLAAGAAMASPALSHLHLLDPSGGSAHAHASVTGDDGMTTSALAAQKTTLAGNANPAAHTADLLHHTSHDDHDRHSRETVMRAQNANKAWTERVSPAAASASKIASIQPRSSSYAAQVDADTAKLNASLANGPAA